jgi:hypothetical protein
VVTGRNAERGEQTVAAIVAEGGQAEFLAADMNDPQSVRRLADQVGEIDALVNTAINNVIRRYRSQKLELKRRGSQKHPVAWAESRHRNLRGAARDPQPVNGQRIREMRSAAVDQPRQQRRCAAGGDDHQSRHAPGRPQRSDWRARTRQPPATS